MERGEKMADVARSYLINRFIIGTIFNNEDNIIEHVNCLVPVHVNRMDCFGNSLF